VLDDQDAEENEGNEKNKEVARVGSVPNGRMAKDRKTAQAGKGIIEMKDSVCIGREYCGYQTIRTSFDRFWNRSITQKWQATWGRTK